jgi:hypothetical protein
MVGQQLLELPIGVRIPAPQPQKKTFHCCCSGESFFVIGVEDEKGAGATGAEPGSRGASADVNS